MVKLITYKNIDLKWWDNYVSKSLRPSIYVKSWYLLDTTFNLLELDNGVAYLFLPIKNSYGINYFSNPAFSQQAGIFSKSQINEDQIKELWNAIPKGKVKYFLRFNGYYPLNFQELHQLNNQILSLDYSYNELYSNFNNNRKRNLRKALNNKLTLIENKFELDEIFAFQEKYIFPERPLSNQLFNQRKALLNSVKANTTTFLIKVSLCNEVIAYAFFAKDDNRIYQLAIMSNQLGKEKQASTFIMNHIIADNCQQNVILDFEGSNISSIAKFNCSFGAINEPYFEFNKNWFPLLRKRL